MTDKVMTASRRPSFDSPSETGVVAIELPEVAWLLLTNVDSGVLFDVVTSVDTVDSLVEVDTVGAAVVLEVVAEVRVEAVVAVVVVIVDVVVVIGVVVVAAVVVVTSITHGISVSSKPIASHSERSSQKIVV